jgi:hypothetical protein
MKRILLITLMTATLFSFAACKKNEEKVEPKGTLKQGPIVESMRTPGHGSSGMNTNFQIEVPPEVKEKWTAVKLSFKDMAENKEQDFTAKVGEDFKIPDSDLTVKIGPFLPDFKISGQVITSASNEPNNPAVRVKIYEKGKQIFPSSGKWGWLYVNFDVHSFQHERYSLKLKSGIEK